MDHYGARPVSLDLARGRSLIAPVATAAPPDLRAVAPYPDVLSAVDRLSLAHWAPGQRVVVCSLDGGVGRTTAATLLALVLAELPYAKAWPPVLLIDGDRREFSGLSERWAAAVDGSGTHVASAAPPEGSHRDRDLMLWRDPTRPDRAAGDSSFGPDDLARRASPVVIDAASGPPTEHPWVRDDPSSVVLLVIRPEPGCVARAGQALREMHDAESLHRRRVVVLVNEGVGKPSAATRTQATALFVRCAAVHRLPWSRQLTAEAELPSGARLRPSLRERIAAIGLDLWRQASVMGQPTPPAIHPNQEVS